MPTAVIVYEVPLLLAFLASTVQCAALPLALNHPRTATAAQFAAAATLALSAQPAPGHLWPLPWPGLLALVAHIGLLGVRHNWALAVGAWWASAGLCVGLVVIDPHHRDGAASGSTLVTYTVSSAVVLAAGLVFAQRGRVRRELLAARRDAELEQSRRAIAEERTHIARELHDVVAHSMSVIHMQASSAQYRHPHLDPDVRAELTQIAGAARSAMREMRQILNVLREDDSDSQRQPAPGLAQLPALVAAATSAGCRTELHLDSALDGHAVPDTVAVAVYRITQEALSNVVRHAPGADTAISIGWDGAGRQITLEISNGRAGSPAPQAVVEDRDAPRRAHLGLVGIDERAGLLGGVAQHGPTSTGGFTVTAHLPVPDGDPDPAPGPMPVPVPVRHRS